MRDDDLAEFSALYPVDTREALADILVARYGSYPGVMCVMGDDRELIAIGGALEFRPRVLTLLFFATPAFFSIAGPLTRFIKQRLFPPLVEAGVHRIEAVSLVTHEEAHRWIKTLGLDYEATHRKFGKGGETFIQFAWVKP